MLQTYTHAHWYSCHMYMCSCSCKCSHTCSHTCTFSQPQPHTAHINAHLQEHAYADTKIQTPTHTQILTYTYIMTTFFLIQRHVYADVFSHVHTHDTWIHTHTPTIKENRKDIGTCTKEAKAGGIPQPSFSRPTQATLKTSQKRQVGVSWRGNRGGEKCAIQEFFNLNFQAV